MNRFTIVLKACSGVLALATMVADAAAQSSSLMGNPGTRKPITVASASWIYQPVQDVKPMKLHDVITVVVDEQQKMTSEADVDQRKQDEGKYQLNNWVVFDKFGLIPDPQTAGSPAIDAKTDNKFRTQANLHNKNSLTFNISCEVVDIRPNGLLVLEGRRKIQNNEEQWEMSLSGTIRPEDILPNNTVRSEKIVDLRILRREAGQGRDGVRRGWLKMFLDHFTPI